MGGPRSCAAVAQSVARERDPSRNGGRLDAARRLRDTDSPVAEITAECGWANPDPPKRLFKKRFGCSMRDYRAQHHI